MIRLEFQPLDSDEWVTSLPLAGHEMTAEPFLSPTEARETAFALRCLWPDLRIRLIETYGPKDERVAETLCP